MQKCYTLLNINQRLTAIFSKYNKYNKRDIKTVKALMAQKYNSKKEYNPDTLCYRD